MLKKKIYLTPKCRACALGELISINENEYTRMH